MKTTQDRINDLWNNLVLDVYEEWKSSQMENDDFLKWLDDSELDEDLINQLTDVYVEYCYDYEIFLDSEENKALFAITQSGSSIHIDSSKENV